MGRPATIASLVGIAPPQPLVAWWHNAAVWISFGIIFLALELPAVFWKRCPWQTLSASSWRFEAWWHPAILFLALAFLALAAHILLHAPVRWLVVAVIGMAVALAATAAWDKLT